MLANREEGRSRLRYIGTEAYINGYPMRAIRTPDFLYIRNFKPQRWPMGDPRGLGSNDQPSYEQLHKSTSITMSDLDANLTKA